MRRPLVAALVIAAVAALSAGVALTASSSHRASAVPAQPRADKHARECTDAEATHEHELQADRRALEHASSSRREAIVRHEADRNGEYESQVEPYCRP
jgi:hypothetical protein